MDVLETKLDDTRRPRQDERLDRMEEKLRGPIKQLKRTSEEDDVLYSIRHRKQSSVTHLHAKWYTWYTQEPRLWSVHGEKRKKSDAKILIAFMKLFLIEGFKLNQEIPSYPDDVISLALKAEAHFVTFLRERGIQSLGASTVLKKLRTLPHVGALDDLIV
uniref:AlNc14C171G7998 protein n=1 Tax=Albugo laibachii Nc14 TaxID=890382 RepID=F0WNH4_9STRA|nr:AlNc14C171G7998 [Albugo laibachii Nc14]|eukprot:CCA22865.1 AlNc14C171G7998 [Albugo laibachii Nc14]